MVKCTDCRNWSKCPKPEHETNNQPACETFEKIDWSVLGERNWT